MNAAHFRKSAIAAAIVLAGSAHALGWSELDDTWLDAIYVPTPHAVAKRMLEIAKAGPDDIHYDLGSGDGRLSIAAAKDFRVKKSVGIDFEPERIRESLINLEKAGLAGRVEFLRRDIFETDFSEASVVTIYLLERLNVKLRPILLSMRPGTRVVTQTFTMKEWKADYVESVPFEDEWLKSSRNVFLYIVPAKIDGRWIMTEGSQEIALDLRQEFQHFTGSAALARGRAEITNGRLSGAAIAFTLEVDGKPATYEGKVNGDTITGTNWTARRAS